MQKMWPVLAALSLSLILLPGCGGGKAKQKSPESLDQILKNAQSLIKQGNYEQAYLNLYQALTISPRDPDVHIDLGWLYLYTDQPEKAHEELVSAFDSRPGYGRGYHLKGAIYSYLEQPEDAIASYNQALKTEIKNPELHYDLAQSYLELNEYQEARMELSTALKMLPKDADKTRYLFGLCSVHYQLKNLSKAEDYCEDAIKQAKNPEERQQILDFTENLKLMQKLEEDVSAG
jgi:tetratricopeptide (TPR) repeat protein